MARKIKKAYEVFEYLKVYKADHDGCPPTYEEIQRHFGWGSIMNAYGHVKVLIKIGLVSIDDRKRIILIGGSYTPPSDDATRSIVEKYESESKTNTIKKRKTKSQLLSQPELMRMYKSQKGKCWWCNCDLNGVYHIDHRVPLSKNGTNAINNLCLACPSCNYKKHNKMPSAFNGRLL